MSKPQVETDADRAARAAATVKVGVDNHGEPVFALMLVDPSGHLVQVPIGSQLKTGWRLATPADHAAAAKAEKERRTGDQAKGRGDKPSAA
jgi:hypothetical protein